tara:strand:+ start:3922 stop:4401 length:480 start_codon:yes stop_codon:yes gene_type:complete
MGDLGDLLSSILSSVGDALGIDEINFEKQEEEARAKAIAQYEKEKAELNAKLKSASARERIQAEKDLKVLQATHKTEIAKSEKEFREKKILGQKRHQEEMEAVRKKIDEKPTKTDASFDREKLSALSRRAKAMPTIPTMPQQGRGVGPTNRDTTQRRPY